MTYIKQGGQLSKQSSNKYSQLPFVSNNVPYKQFFQHSQPWPLPKQKTTSTYS